MKLKSLFNRIAKNPQINSLFNYIALAGVSCNKKQLSGGATLLIAPPGAGNIGDQALVESFIENVSGKIIILVPAPDAFVITQSFRSAIELVSMPRLIYGGLPLRIADLFKLRKLLSRVKYVCIVGADIMDGAYNNTASVNRSLLAQQCAMREFDTRILGFSWNAQPTKQALLAIKQAHLLGAKLYLRDPVSHARAVDDGLVQAIKVADMVFAANMIDKQAPSDILPDRIIRQGYAMVNVSGLVDSLGSLNMEYVKICQSILAYGIAVVLLPHVFREGRNGDLEACQRLYEKLDSHYVYLVEEMLTPAQIRGMAKSAEFTITGRMHLAIMSLHMGTPAIAMATQGKVEGLMEMFELSQMCVTPGQSMSEEVVHLIEHLLQYGRPVKKLAVDKIADVCAKSRKNFIGLPQNSKLC
jgi:polysaccharide pyruvyl transferase WcaK-like protein